MLHDEVITLLHELGHCLHHLLSQVDEYSLSGIHGVEWDAVELPSQLFEHWGWEKSILPHLSKHCQTQEPLPLDLMTSLQQSKTFLTGLALLRQIEFALFDLQIHNQAPPADPDWVHKSLQTIRQSTCVTPTFKDNRFECSFSHIFAGGYAAGYYSYFWAEVLSSDAFSRFEKEGILNKKTGQELLHVILETGSLRPLREQFEKFMGRPASIQAFLRHRGITA